MKRYIKKETMAHKISKETYIFFNLKMAILVIYIYIYNLQLSSSIVFDNI